ncbi:uncharacterized protein EDB93DRAFT_1269737 [Suillus bovinus]|uniref:uncharacterized protein n=1 Tax=Suillus bovinus TaxID=48563 RepID=UPI001B880419|nr:uncharacterized protein EDB93DRAFT_1269737 [Suillus bovinus]KAG2127909.1 hypothetical protein EDB93DRAFT_1269737 [Suillus bovinus]
MAHSKRPRRNTQLLNQDNSEHEVQVNALKPRFCAPSPEEYVDEEPPLHLFFDSLKTDFAELDTSDLETGSDMDDQDEWEELNDEWLLAVMSEMDNKLQDPDWLPERLQKKVEIHAKSKTARPRTYANSFTSQSERTSTLAPDRDAMAGPANIARHVLPMVAVPVRQTTLSMLQPEWQQYSSSSTIPRTRLASVLLDQASSDEPEPTEIMDLDESAAEEVEDVDDETWEDELMLSARGVIMKFHDWSKMRENIKSDLKKNSKSLSLAHINKLTILSNFATLCIKGCSWIQASIEIAWQWHEGEGIHFAWKV